jgi:hypothetical protein
MALEDGIKQRAENAAYLTAVSHSAFNFFRKPCQKENITPGQK